MDRLPIQSKRLKVSYPQTPNARILLVASGALILSSAAFLTLFSGPRTSPLGRAAGMVFAIAGVAGVFAGLGRLLSVTVPQQSSRLASDGAVMSALVHRSISGKDNVIIMRRLWERILLWLVPDERLIEMRPRFRDLVLWHARRGGKLIVTLLVLVFARIFVPIPFMIWSVLAFAAALFAALDVVVLLAFRSGDAHGTSVHIASEVIPSAGHPQMLFAILENKARSLDTEGYSVWLNNQEPKLKVEGVADTGKFESHVFLEEQPFPIPDTDRVPFSLIGFPAGCAGVLVGAWLLLYALSRPMLQAGIPYLALLAVWTLFAWRVAALAWRLESFFQFKSNLCLVWMDGTFSRSHVRIGKGMVDSIESDNVAFRSDIRVRYFAAQGVTESPGITKPRALVALTATPEAEARIRLFEEGAIVFRNTGVAPLRIDMTGGTSDVVRANLGVRAAAASAGTEAVPILGPAVPVAALETTAGSAAQVASDDEKVCPDCAETIKAAARKCRFCGHMFE